jgi:hypothetical protein
MAKIITTDLDVFPLALGGNVFGWTPIRKNPLRCSTPMPLRAAILSTQRAYRRH